LGDDRGCVHRRLCGVRRALQLRRVPQRHRRGLSCKPGGGVGVVFGNRARLLSGRSSHRPSWGSLRSAGHGRRRCRADGRRTGSDSLHRPTLGRLSHLRACRRGRGLLRLYPDLGPDRRLVRQAAPGGTRRRGGGDRRRHAGRATPGRSADRALRLARYRRDPRPGLFPAARRVCRDGAAVAADGWRGRPQAAPGHRLALVPDAVCLLGAWYHRLVRAVRVPAGIRIGMVRLFRACVLIMGASNLLWLTLPTYGGLILFVVVLGLAYGARIALMPGVLIEFFGLQNLGVILGAFFTGSGIASILGPMLAGVIVDRTGSYHWGIVFALAAGLLAFLTIVPLRHKAAAHRNAAHGQAAR